MKITEKVKGNKKVLIHRSYTCDKGRYSYHLSFMFYQPYLSMGWVIYFGEKQTKDIYSLKEALAEAEIYLNKWAQSK